LWEWRSFSKTFQKGLLDRIENLPVKADRPTRMTDNYVWMPDCSSNIKLRERDLKIKHLMNSCPCHLDDTSRKTTYAQQWTTEAFGFPISASLMKRISKELNINDIPGTLPLITDKERFVSLLQSLSNSLRVVAVSKEREQRLFPIDGNNNYDKEISACVTIEISYMTNPEEVTSICIEHTNINKVLAAVSKIMMGIDKKTYGDMIFMNYLEAVKVWALDKKLF
jgi:hypothetical protein